MRIIIIKEIKDKQDKNSYDYYHYYYHYNTNQQIFYFIFSFKIIDFFMVSLFSAHFSLKMLTHSRAKTAPERIIFSYSISQHLSQKFFFSSGKFMEQKLIEKEAILTKSSKCFCHKMTILLLRCIFTFRARS